ncbi:MAG: DUF424 family protein [archaeon]|nr:MAG: DUF424 family protein [archaeon]
MFSYKIFRVPKEVLVSVCDQEVLGKKLDENFEVDEKFYGGKNCGKDEIRKILEEATIINAVGNIIVDFLINENFVEKEKTIKIGGVLHAQVAKL